VDFTEFPNPLSLVTPSDCNHGAVSVVSPRSTSADSGDHCWFLHHARLSPIASSQNAAISCVGPRETTATFRQCRGRRLCQRQGKCHSYAFFAVFVSYSILSFIFHLIIIIIVYDLVHQLRGLCRLCAPNLWKQRSRYLSPRASSTHDRCRNRDDARSSRGLSGGRHSIGNPRRTTARGEPSTLLSRCHMVPARRVDGATHDEPGTTLSATLLVQ
jgi:hypothetical protein